MVSLNEGCDGPLGTRRCHAVLQAFRGPRKKASKASASPQTVFRALRSPQKAKKAMNRPSPL